MGSEKSAGLVGDRCAESRRRQGRIQFDGFGVVLAYPTTGGTLSILWIILIVILVLALLGFFGRGRF